MLHFKKDAIKEIAVVSKNLALDLKKDEFDQEKMRDNQKKMFIVL